MLTVIIPVRNGAQTLMASVRSAERAGADHVIVVDDGSSDETVSLVKESGASLLMAGGVGAARARMLGAEGVASGYLIFLDADDELHPAGVRQSVALLNEDISISVAGGRIRCVYPSGRGKSPARDSGLISARAMLISGFGPWPPGAAVIRKAALDATLHLPMAPLAPQFAEDYEMFIRLALVSPLRRHEGLSLSYSIFSGRSSRSARNAILDKELVRRHYAEALGLDIGLLSNFGVFRATTSLRVAAAVANRDPRLMLPPGRQRAGMSDRA